MSEPRPRAWIEPAAIAAGLVALVAWSAWQRYQFLAGSPYPMGVDGYFYPIQLRSVLEHGTLQYPASPLAFYLMAPLAWLTDPITGAKLGAAIGGALIALPAYAVGKRLGGGRVAGITAALVASTSAGSWYLTAEFVKNGWGLSAALTAVWLILRALETRTPRRIALAVLGVVVAALTHKMALALVGVLGGGAAIATVVAGARLTRAQWLRSGSIAGGVALAVVVAALTWPERFLAGRDLGLIGDLFTRDAHWDAPALFLDDGRFVLPMGYEARTAGIAALLAIGVLVAAIVWRGQPWWRATTRPAAATGAAIGAIALALFVALPWLDVGDPQGLGFRLRIAAFVPLALVAAVIAGAIVPFAAPELARAPAPRLTAAAVIVALAIGAAALGSDRRPEGIVRAHPAMVAATMALAGEVPAGDVVVTSERHILYMAAYYARVPITLRPEAIPPSRRWRLMPLAFIGRNTSLYRLLLSARTTPGVDPPHGLHPRDPNGLVILPESTWTWILDRLPPTPQRYFREWHTI